MDRNELLIAAVSLIDFAVTEDGIGQPDTCTGYLIGLRELLNEHPELVDPGTTRHCRICGCTDLSACPDGCHWVENDLCSNCI